jgi:hypothetical protein
MEIVEADAWIIKHRSHRQHSVSMDEKLAAGIIDKDLDHLYRPYLHHQNYLVPCKTSMIQQKGQIQPRDPS